MRQARDRERDDLDLGDEIPEQPDEPAFDRRRRRRKREAALESAVIVDVPCDGFVRLEDARFPRTKLDIDGTGRVQAGLAYRELFGHPLPAAQIRAAAGLRLSTVSFYLDAHLLHGTTDLSPITHGGVGLSAELELTRRVRVGLGASVVATRLTRATSGETLVGVGGEGRLLASWDFARLGARTAFFVVGDVVYASPATVGPTLALGARF